MVQLLKTAEEGTCKDVGPADPLQSFDTQSAPLRSPGAQLQDFTFTIEAKCNAWHKGLWRDWDEGDRKYYPEGAWDSWTGTLPGFSDDAWWDLPDA